MVTERLMRTPVVSDPVPTTTAYGENPALIQNTSAGARDGMLYSVFQQLRAASSDGVMVAITSANSGEGVTYSTTSLVNSLSKDSTTRILQIDARSLQEVTCLPQAITQKCQQVDSNIYEFVDGPHPAASNDAYNSWTGNWEYRRECVRGLRSAFDFILVDCPALNVAGDVLSLAPLVDGIIMVIQADKTRIDQIQHAERSIEFARGKLVGHILNKRTFSVPNWLYKRL